MTTGGNVRFGSLADIKERQSHVRFTPESRHSSAPVACPLSAISGHPPLRRREVSRALELNLKIKLVGEIRRSVAQAK